MDADRAERLVGRLRARGVMAHVAEAGVYTFGVRVVLGDGREALWDVDGAAGLDAEIVSDGVLVGYVPHVPGSEGFTEDQLVASIATTDYTSPPPSPTADGRAQSPAPGPGRPTMVPPSAADRTRRRPRRSHWIHHHRQ